MKPRPSSPLLRTSETDRLIRQFRRLRCRWSKDHAHLPGSQLPEFDEIIVHLDEGSVEC